MDIKSKPDFETCMQRIDAWFHQAVIDRPPVRFNRGWGRAAARPGRTTPAWQSLKERWFDAAYQVETYLEGIEGQRFYGESIPVFCPNLGPDFLAACFDVELEFGEETSWAIHNLEEYGSPPALDWHSEYLLKVEELTRAALQASPGNFVVGYTDLHPGLDWLAAMRDPQRLCVDLYEHPQEVKTYLRAATDGFLAVYDHFDALLKAAGQPSVGWMGIPAARRLHLPSCDFSSMISTRFFAEFQLPELEREMRAMSHNIFHMDGKGVARHLDLILQLPNLQAIQWAQGPGKDWPILQWVPLIRRIQAAGKSLVIDLEPADLEDFIAELHPEGLLLVLNSTSEDEELAILKRVEKW